MNIVLCGVMLAQGPTVHTQWAGGVGVCCLEHIYREGSTAHQNVAISYICMFVQLLQEWLLASLCICSVQVMVSLIRYCSSPPFSLPSPVLPCVAVCVCVRVFVCLLHACGCTGDGGPDVGRDGEEETGTGGRGEKKEGGFVSMR